MTTMIMTTMMSVAEPNHLVLNGGGRGVERSCRSTLQPPRSVPQA